MYKKILVPLDGSDLAACVLSHLKSLIENGSASEVTLLNIVTIDIPWRELEEGHFNFDALRQQVFASSGKYLAEMKTRLSAGGVKVTTESIEANRPAEAITDYASNKGMDLIVMATHGHTGIKKLVMGSVASGVLNQSSVPVLLIRPEACRV
ncbi:MAG: universal stress protein [Thermodesulfobacteriota bacterium]